MRLFGFLKTSVSNLLNQSLIYSVSYNSTFLAKCCIKCGADMNVREDCSGRSPLHIAAAKGNQKMVELLLTNGANPTLQNAMSNTPLHMAAEKGNQKMVELLLKNGAIPTLQNNQGNTPLYIAKEKGNQSIVQLLQNVSKPYTSTPLHTAVIKRDKEEVTKLLAASANVNAQDEETWTPLHRATMEGLEQIIQLLLDHYADIEAKNYCGKTPLLVAKNPEIFNLLLNNSADVTVVTSEKEKNFDYRGTCWEYFTPEKVLAQFQTGCIHNKVPEEEWHNKRSTPLNDVSLLTGEDSPLSQR